MNRRLPSRPRMAGFTAVELMVVVVIVGILTAAAIPSMRDMIRNNRLKTTSFDVFSGLVLARSEAIKRNTSVTVTPNGGNWALGWVAQDANGNIVARQDAFIPTIGGTADPNSVPPVTIAGPGNPVTFSGIGRTNAIASFTIEAPNIATGRCIKLDMSGRAVSSLGACT